MVKSLVDLVFTGYLGGYGEFSWEDRFFLRSRSWGPRSYSAMVLHFSLSELTNKKSSQNEIYSSVVRVLCVRFP